MGTLDKIKDILKLIQRFFYPAVVIILLIVIQFKNGTIKRQSDELLKKPDVEYVYNTIKDTIPIDKPIPVEVIKWKDTVVTEYVELPIDLTKEDSASIAHEYLELYENYSNIYVYQDVLKDDSLAFVQLNEKTQYNKVFDREFIYEDRTPVIYKTNTVVKEEKTYSLVGGLNASIGADFNSLSLGVGIVNASNRVYLFKYDPINKGYGFGAYFPIFNINR